MSSAAPSRPRGDSYSSSYDVDGGRAKVTGRFAREQTQAAIARGAVFTMRFYGEGAGIMLGVQATARRATQMHTAREVGTPSATTPIVMERIASPRIGLRGVGTTRPPWEVNPDAGVIDWPEPVDTGPILPPIGPGGGGGGGGGFTHAPIIVELFAPGLDEPVQRWEFQEEVEGTYRILKFVPPQGFPTPDAPVRRKGWWRMTVKPTGPDPVMIKVEAYATVARLPFRTTTISKRLFDHLFRVVLEAMVPQARIEGRTLKVGIGPELAAMVGRHPVIVEKDIYPLVSWAKLTSLDITAISGARMKEIAREKGRLDDRIKRVGDDHIAIRIQAGFYNASASAYGFDVARLNGEFGQLLLAFNPRLSEVTPLAIFDVSFSRLVGALLTVKDLFTEVDYQMVNTEIHSAIYREKYLFCRYLKEVLSRALGLRAVLHEVTYSGDAWHCRYFDEPELPLESTRWRSPLHDTMGVGGASGGLLDGRVIAGMGADPVPAEPAEPQPSPTGDDSPTPTEPSPSEGQPVPSDDRPLSTSTEFQFAQGPALERLDRHKSIVVVMMENRSYDHLLGGLAKARPRASGGYDGPPDRAKNASAGGFVDGVPLVNARAINAGTAILVSPDHHHHPVLFQMGDGTTEGAGSGAMQGFARDVHRRTDSPQLAMTMYGEPDMPTYYRLADEFCVCDRWFCSHPGPTWPNRFAMLMGSIPELDNYENDDPRIGFMKEQSIFDVLTNHGVEWKVFESDLSIVRMFDRWRLDDRRVVPIDDKNDGFDATLRSPAALPRVMFVEPNFADLPPFATANDDHPPADLKAGQEFIARVCDSIWTAGRFRDCLLVITYDEHGGFYDHVPPPGTPAAEPTPVGPRSKLHPDGPEVLGPRVPSFIVSPFVSAGSISRTIFDHTSILKTILVHNRERVPAYALSSFGDRVNAAAHLGEALDLESARQTPLPFDPAKRPRPRLRWPDEVGGPWTIAAERIGRRGTGGASSASGAGSASAGSMEPEASAAGTVIPERTVTVVPRPQGFVEEVEEPREYHAALRNALKPRR